MRKISEKYLINNKEIIKYNNLSKILKGKN